MNAFCEHHKDSIRFGYRGGRQIVGAQQRVDDAARRGRFRNKPVFAASGVLGRGRRDGGRGSPRRRRAGLRSDPLGARSADPRHRLRLAAGARRAARRRPRLHRRQWHRRGRPGLHRGRSRNAEAARLTEPASRRAPPQAPVALARRASRARKGQRRSQPSGRIRQAHRARH
jgi:hypothetical protein